MKLEIDARPYSEKVLVDGTDVSETLKEFTVRRDRDGRYTFEPKYEIEALSGSLENRIELQESCEKCWVYKNADIAGELRKKRITLAVVSLAALAMAALAILLILR